MQHSNAKLSPDGRRRLVIRVLDEGMSLAQAARHSGGCEDHGMGMDHKMAGGLRRAACHLVGVL